MAACGVVENVPRQARQARQARGQLTPGFTLCFRRQQNAGSGRASTVFQLVLSVHFFFVGNVDHVQDRNGIGCLRWKFKFAGQFQIGGQFQGGRTLSRWYAKDFGKELGVPSGHASSHRNTFLVVDLLEKADREAFEPS
ncbi:hypothetical protein CA13_57950 [Planctomycetes bacterium CA13]|uniref:Uncharacterized protein n=1 Tax=Novipirellula herctigrandis TaxID=2527986 RepID=A0A5C5ZAZ1_9BACT|nr:hypothetical protein CA13_57950 [Planctomycetes bacterium CA13]